MVLGTLLRFDEQTLELRNADLHDLRDADSTRELYVAEARYTGVQRNRKRVMVVRAEVVAVSGWRTWWTSESAPRPLFVQCFANCLHQLAGPIRFCDERSSAGRQQRRSVALQGVAACEYDTRLRVNLP